MVVDTTETFPITDDLKKPPGRHKNGVTPVDYGVHMTRTSPQFRLAHGTLAVGLISIAASVALVGVVWASTAAIGEDNDSAEVSSSTSIPGDDSNSESDDSVSSSDVNARLEALTLRINEASEQLTKLSNEFLEITATSESTQTQITKLSSKIDTLKNEISDAVEDVRKTRASFNDLEARVLALTSVVEKKTVLIDDEGKYIGSIGPSQITPQLRVSDVLGKWPLDRTEGDLDVSKLYSDLFSCTSDSRNHAVLSIDVFRRMTCLRIPK